MQLKYLHIGAFVITDPGGGVQLVKMRFHQRGRTVVEAPLRPPKNTQAQSSVPVQSHPPPPGTGSEPLLPNESAEQWDEYVTE